MTTAAWEAATAKLLLDVASRIDFEADVRARLTRDPVAELRRLGVDAELAARLVGGEIEDEVVAFAEDARRVAARAHALAMVLLRGAEQVPGVLTDVR